MIKTKERPENLIDEELDMETFLTKDLLAEKPHTGYKLQSAVFVQAEEAIEVDSQYVTFTNRTTENKLTNEKEDVWIKYSKNSREPCKLKNVLSCKDALHFLIYEQIIP